MPTTAFSRQYASPGAPPKSRLSRPGFLDMNSECLAFHHPRLLDVLHDLAPQPCRSVTLHSSPLFAPPSVPTHPPCTHHYAALACTFHSPPCIRLPSPPCSLQQSSCRSEGAHAHPLLDTLASACDVARQAQLQRGVLIIYSA